MAVFGLSSLPVRGAWIEMIRLESRKDTMKSLPVRGAWIEMVWRMKPQHRSAVAPRAGSVD